MSPSQQSGGWSWVSKDGDGDVSMNGGGSPRPSELMEEDLVALEQPQPQSQPLSSVAESPVSTDTLIPSPIDPPPSSQSPSVSPNGGTRHSLQQVLGLGPSPADPPPAAADNNRGRNLLSRLRIGSSGSPTPIVNAPAPETPSERLASPAPIPSGVPLNFGGSRLDQSRSPEGGSSWDAGSFGYAANRSRASSNATSASQSLSRSASVTGGGNPLSPAQSFLSSFSPPGSVSFGGKFASLGLASTPTGEEEGHIVHGYKLGRELGSGGFAVVREAHKVPGGGAADHLPERIAIKIIRHTPAAAADEGHHRPAGAFDGPRRVASGVYHKPEKSRRMSLVANDRSRAASVPWQGSAGHSSSAVPTLASSRMASPRWSPQQLSASLELPARQSSIGRSPSTRVPPQSHTPPQEVNTNPDRIKAVLDREVDLWSQLKNEHIVTLLGTAQHGEEFSYLLMPLCEGGNLLEHLNSGGKTAAERKKGRSSEIGGGWTALGASQSGEVSVGVSFAAAKDIFGQITEALAYLHLEAGITHKDLKLENLLLETSADGTSKGKWKLADFGLADAAAELPFDPSASLAPSQSGTSTPASRTRAGNGTSFTPLGSLSRANSLSRHQPASVKSFHEILHPAGSLPYSPPEQMKSPIPILHPGVDIWAAGCVLYALVSGRLPINNDFEPKLRSLIIKGEWDIPARLKAEPKDDEEREEQQMLLELLKGCLEPDPNKRWSIEQVRECRWLTGVAPDTFMETLPSEPIGAGGHSRGRSPHPSTRSIKSAASSNSRSRSRSALPPPSPSAERGRSSLLGPEPHKPLTRSQSRARAAATAAVGALGLEGLAAGLAVASAVSDERGRGRGRSNSSARRGRSSSQASVSASGSGRSLSRGGEQHEGVGAERRKAWRKGSMSSAAQSAAGGSTPNPGEPY